MFNWLSGRDAARVGAALADDFVLQTAPGSDGPSREKRGSQGQELQKLLQKFLLRVDHETGALKLNIFKRATLANSFKWRLLEKGVEQNVVEELTQALVLRLTTSQPEPPVQQPVAAVKGRLGRDEVQTLLVKAGNHSNQGAYEDAVECFQEALAADPGNVNARNSLGVILCRLGRYQEGGEQFRQAIKTKEKFADAHFNLGSLLRSQGRIRESEASLRRALALKPTLVGAQVSLAATLCMLGRTEEARNCLEKALRVSPRALEALTNMGHLCALEGRFADAEGWFNRALEVDPKSSFAWVGLAGLGHTAAKNGAWLTGAQASADSGLPPLNEASLRYAIGKHHDRAGDFAQAFQSFRRAKELIKTAAESYDRDAQTRIADAIVASYSREALLNAQSGASSSKLPILVVGMPRSGTSLIEQIVASHPTVGGAGEVEFWSRAIPRHARELSNGLPDKALRDKLAQGYLRALAERSNKAARVVDKSLFNVDYLGVISSVFPEARIINVQRDPIDTCLSCYFQDFPPNLNFTLDLADLTHFYRYRHRLMQHWREVLPPGTLLDVRYEDLVANQAMWTRRILEFLELPWDERCLKFQDTQRSVPTASYWQVRQKLYASSVGRWRNYEKFIGPLRGLKDLR
jgi:tetratricopeptide (TPR) repeat protein